jgi:hypothetical protein
MVMYEAIDSRGSGLRRIRVAVRRIRVAVRRIRVAMRRIRVAVRRIRVASDVILKETAKDMCSKTWCLLGIYA